VTPTGDTTAITQPISGTGLPDITNALNGMGTGDNKNALGFTALSHGYGQDSTTLAAIRDYVGVGDQLIGCFAKEVARNFYSATGEVAAGSAGLAAAIVFGDARTTDRANSLIAAPGSYSHPSEIGAQYIGLMERDANLVSAKSYGGLQFSRIHGGSDADRWTNDRANRTLAVNAGISCTKVDGGVLELTDTISLYHPNSIPESSNIYREISNLRKIRNVLNSLKVTYNGPPFPGSFIVQDTNKIASSVVRSSAIDENVNLSTLFALIDAWAGKGWLYETDFAKANTVTAVRTATDGFDSVIKAILSGVGKIFDNQVQADISTAVLN
jgi:phage tail sheath gpL-like